MNFASLSLGPAGPPILLAPSRVEGDKAAKLARSFSMTEKFLTAECPNRRAQLHRANSSSSHQFLSDEEKLLVSHNVFVREWMDGVCRTVVWPMAQKKAKTTQQVRLSLDRHLSRLQWVPARPRFGGLFNPKPKRIALDAIESIQTKKPGLDEVVVDVIHERPPHAVVISFATPNKTIDQLIVACLSQTEATQLVVSLTKLSEGAVRRRADVDSTKKPPLQSRGSFTNQPRDDSSMSSYGSAVSVFDDELKGAIVQPDTTNNGDEGQQL
ncbi:Aste57867_25548 [Aphanomyces stellatus]|uniref:Aste57867_25548 protein n=1 Tax=Aphanomyces stellatus TaxID=120398 RepID=A0A485LU36_9STRA|nr:hypothetical protein As57867_025469 [Aphanomyces stellatus]VFU02171.1 Aste57867_25548 [Aphanomyces stellatus]